MPLSGAGAAGRIGRITGLVRRVRTGTDTTPGRLGAPTARHLDGPAPGDPVPGRTPHRHGRDAGGPWAEHGQGLGNGNGNGTRTGRGRRT
ncbi:hypothetical protein R2F25_03470 [Streptomyces sp. UP1A-1]|nr:hypothetical protein [Streptomyces sp. UP1A-1]